MATVKISTVEDLVKADQLYEVFNGARRDAEAARDRFLAGRDSREEWAHYILDQERAWRAWLRHVGLDDAKPLS